MHEVEADQVDNNKGCAIYTAGAVFVILFSIMAGRILKEAILEYKDKHPPAQKVAPKR